MRRVRDLVPDNRRQVVEPERSAAVLDGGVQRHHGMPAAVLAPRQADVANDADKPSAEHKRGVTQAPDLVELVEKLVVVGYPAQLASGATVLLQGPVRGRRQHQVDRLRRKDGAPGVPEQQPVSGRHLPDGGLDRRHRGRILRDSRQIARQVRQSPKRFRNEGAERRVAVHLACVPDSQSTVRQLRRISTSAATGRQRRSSAGCRLSDSSPARSRPRGAA